MRPCYVVSVVRSSKPVRQFLEVQDTRQDYDTDSSTLKVRPPCHTTPPWQYSWQYCSHSSILLAGLFLQR